MNYKIHTGLCQNVLAQMEENSIDAIVTDPPYGLSFMGKKWDYDVPSVEIWQACLRVLKPGGYLLAFAGTRTQHRMAVRIEDAGFEIRDMIAWVYGSGFPKSHNVSKAIDKAAGAEREVVGRGQYADRGRVNGNNQCSVGDSSASVITAPATEAAKQWEGWGTALKPALEPITVARKPFKGTVAENVLEYGTGGINIDGCRVGINDKEDIDLNPRKSGNSGFTAQNGIYCGKKEYGLEKHQPMKSAMDNGGRFPANLIHDGSDEVLWLFPETTSGGHKPHYNLSKDENGHVPAQVYGKYKRIPYDRDSDSGSAARFFYCAKASKADRNEGLTEGTVSKHPTVKPTDLMRYLCRLVTPPNGTVLDPFAGSGSTGKGAILEGFTPILIEADKQWADIIKARCEFALKQYNKENAQTRLF